MSRHLLFYIDPKLVRDTLNDAVETADEMLLFEARLIEKLRLIDQKRYYVRYGFRSLTGFVRHYLRISKTQTQRIVTQVRRNEPTDNNMDRDISGKDGRQ